MTVQLHVCNVGTIIEMSNLLCIEIIFNSVIRGMQDHELECNEYMQLIAYLHFMMPLSSFIYFCYCYLTMFMP